MDESDEALLRRVLKKVKSVRTSGDRIILQIDVSVTERTQIAQFVQRKPLPPASTAVS